MPTTRPKPTSPGAAAAAPASISLPPLIGPDDPQPVRVINPQARARVLLVCDHAGRAVPKALDRLGIDDDAVFDRHIAYDIGAGDVTRRLAERFAATAVLSAYSRLVLDVNRGLDDPTLMPVISDGVVIPANRTLDTHEEQRRIAAFFNPYHAAIAAEIRRLRGHGIVPAILSVHSFTPVLHDFQRPWHIGVLWDQDGRIAVPLIGILRRDPGLHVGDNQPYSGRNTGGGTIETHATPAGLPNVLIEIRQDLIDTPGKAVAWADRLYMALAAILADDDLYRGEHPS